MRTHFGVVVALGVAVVVASCARGYEDENRAIFSELPDLEGVELIAEHHGSYCSGDSCLFGDDRSSARLTFAVDTDRYTPDSLIQAYQEWLVDWEPAAIDRWCIEKQAPCDDILSATFARGQERISLGLDNWPIGEIDVGIDARFGDR